MPMPKRPEIDTDALIDAVLTRALRLHRRIFEASKGRIGARIGGTRCLLLHTTGRRSGLERTATLAYATDGEALVLVASNNGSDSEPDWMKNLRADPHVEVQLGTERRRASARIVERFSEGYERLLRLANANTGWRYFHYQQKTTRPIPVVVLTLEAA